MHINVHVAIGLISTSILNSILTLNLIEYSIILISSFLCDFDVLFYRITKHQNHRLFITHSFIPSIILIIIGIILGIILNWYILFWAGLTYFLHIFIDMFDWGTNIFYFPKKQQGPKLLISNEEVENLSTYLASYKTPQSFFDAKYYNNRICILIEIISFVCMILFLVLYALEYIFFISFYFLGLWFHLSRHYQLKKIERS